MADANQVELAILNLVINGRDAMASGGVLKISSRTAQSADGSVEGDYVVVSVADQGVGIPAAMLDKVFEPFFTTKPIGKGTGLGLSQVYGIAQQSGGRARIESVEGQGATVEIWLPLTQAPREQDVGAAPAPAEQGGARARVLLVEDDEGVRRFIVESLEMLGYAVVAAAHGREGLERLEDAMPELMIIDYAMPGLNGVEVAAAARARAPSLPIILATGYADMEAVHKLFDAAHILRKPFQINDLDVAVRRALAEVA
jgi:CheY-like chemotaxis protein